MVISVMTVAYTATIFLSSALLFWVELIIARMILPLLGGAPAVWNAIMLFFQAILLAGYLYSHLAASRISRRFGIPLHFVILFLGLAVLPVSLSRTSPPPTATNPLPWLLTLLLFSVGLPTLAISATSPMLQKWFSRSGHPAAGDPYFLYSTGNLGSLTALMTYPLLLEPAFTLKGQSRLWAAGYFLLVVFLAACALLTSRSKIPPQAAISAGMGKNDPPPSYRAKVRWLLLSMLPSSLLLGVTSYITQDVASAPFLWVIPLSLYLLSFVFVFARRTWIPHRLMVKAQPFVVLPLAAVIAASTPMYRNWIIYFLLNLTAFFITAMVCHGEMARTRPAAAYLTGFYLWLAAGGVLGGLFNALLAPLLFKTVAEYPLALILACFLRPAPEEDSPRLGWRVRDFVLPALLGLAAFAGLRWFPWAKPSDTLDQRFYYLLALGLLVCLLGMRPLGYGLSVGALLLAGSYGLAPVHQVIYHDRDYFGTIEVVDDYNYHWLNQGKTLHGGQSAWPAYRRTPLSYYTEAGPLGYIFFGLEEKLREKRIAVTGLGAGVIAAYGEPGQTMDFYEISPAVIKAARDPSLFTYLADCRAKIRIIEGDARLKLAEAPDNAYSLIIADTYSSDQIPPHLLTREALRLYLSKLADGGIMAFHISNYYLDLEPVLADLARDANLICMVNIDFPPVMGDKDIPYISDSAWVAMGRSLADFGTITYCPGWRLSPGIPGRRLWTDDYTNIAGAFRWLHRLSRSGT